MLSLIRIYVLPLREKSSSKSGADKRKITLSQRIIPIGLTCPQTDFHNFGASDIPGKTYPFPTLSFRAQREIFFVPFFPPPSLSRLRETPPPPFLQYGVSRFSLPNTRPLAANKKDPSLSMTIRGISPYHAQKSPSQSWSFFMSERLICQTARAWCLLLLQYQ